MHYNEIIYNVSYTSKSGILLAIIKLAASPVSYLHGCYRLQNKAFHFQVEFPIFPTLIQSCFDTFTRPFLCSTLTELNHLVYDLTSIFNIELSRGRVIVRQDEELGRSSGPIYSSLKLYLYFMFCK